ncbi:class I poly(R)-hydroxyalkanoic acid synthase [Phenylobacterium sp.]|jgi:polyhydroxyalkanoate synthase|uniref:class I poly(R)-hydroxyalkanoic acid synthase n=1 Tax=Phenylobacterium sp. TaxID=1871053 RepID=UPI000C981753|nr:class I poly(R)-hydroxyalkanoic acid synthase [Phenylobacterium sp.]MAK81056.1 class I poly(R)-hydroxyalkanoic acid synthase [Phenylobacterium sp.]|tara:strand:+ start:2743 stop:4749 length:2007 start_codon:yes stop_codon:yes gene_type:complete
MSEKSQKSRKTAAKPAPPPKPSAGKSPSAKTKAAAAVAGAPATKPKAAKRPQPTTARDTAPPPPPKETLPPPAAAQLSGDQQRMLENLSTNLARAAMTAQGAIAEAALRNADRPAALSTDPFHIAPALTEVMGKLASQPDRLVRAQADLLSRYMDLWQSTARRMAGETPAPVASPAKGDKRFLDPDWSENPVFDVMKQSYLVTADWLNSLVGDVEGVDPMARRRVEFFMKLLTDAFSPTNFLASNPTALREIMVTGGESLVRGMENFAADLARGGGQLSISQTDYEQFKIGENVATAPGKVVFQNELLQLLQFTPSTEQVHEIPLLIFPPWINKFYILDLRPDNSMIRWLTDQGITVFVVSWVNPDRSLATKTFDDYLRQGIYEATDAAMTQAGVKSVNAVGYCIGGTLLSAALAHMAAKGDKRIASATFFAAQQDFSEAGDLLLFTDESWLKDLEHKMDAEGGVLSGQAMADTFNVLRSNDLIWSFFVNNYLMGKEPRPFDLLFWNSDQTRMPKALHMFYLRKFYGQNALAKGELEVDGIKLNLGTVKTPIYVQSSKEDHIAPARSVYRGARLFGGPVTFTLAGSGHIAGVVNPPSAKKYQHWTFDQLPEDLASWQTKAVETPGSWWPHWITWLKSYSGDMVPARNPTKGPLKPIEDAPGSYVQVKS